MSLPEITEFIRRHRGGRSDEALRRDLLLQGHRPDDVEAAFALSEATATHLETRRASVEAEETSGVRWGLVALALGGAAVLAAVVALGVYGRGRRLRAEDAMAAQLAAYRPREFARPPRLGLVVGDDLLDADAAPDYARLFNPATLGAADALGAAGAAALDAALGKRRCTAALNWYPATKADLLRKRALLSRGIAAADAALAAQAEQARARGDAAAALEAARRRVHFGWHMMQDFSLAAQAGGLAAAQEGLQRYSRAAREAGKTPEEGPLAFGKLSVELSAYGPRPEELRALLGLGAQRSDYAALTRYVSKPELKRPYLEAALLAAATNWSEEEALAASPWPERLELMRLAREAIDPRAARIGQGYDGLLESMRRALEEQPPERRLEALREARAGLNDG